MRYRNRSDAGHALAEAIEAEGLISRDTRPLILGIPRGGVPVAAVIADRIGGDLDVLVARKLGAPGNPEYAIGAVAEDGTVILDDAIVERLGISAPYVETERRRQRAAVQQRAHELRGDRPPMSTVSRLCVVVDDGVATGSTLEVALSLVARSGADQIIAAIPVGPPETIRRLGAVIDAVVCPLQPPTFFAVGTWYDDFSQVSEETVIATLDRFRRAG